MGKSGISESGNKMKKLARMDVQSTLRKLVMRASRTWPAMSNLTKSPNFKPSVSAIPCSTLTPSASSAVQRPAVKGL